MKLFMVKMRPLSFFRILFKQKPNLYKNTVLIYYESNINSLFNWIWADISACRPR